VRAERITVLKATTLNVLAIVLASSTWTPFAQAHAHEAGRAHSVQASFLDYDGVHSLGRLTRTQMVGKAPLVVTAGIRLYVPAQPGLSRESLHAAVRAEIDRAQQGPLSTRGLHARVVSASAGYVVELSAPNATDARKLVSDLEALVSERAQD
jgi:hypothetical protein